MPDENGGQNLIEKNDGTEIEKEDAALEALETEILAMTDEEIAADPAKAEKLKEYDLKHAKTTIKQKQHWREKAKAAKPEAKDPATEPKPKEAPAAANEEFAKREARLDFRIEHPEVSKALINEIEEFAVANKITLEEAFKRPIVQEIVEKRKTKDDVMRASPSSKHRSNAASDPNKDWSRATNEEVAAKRREILSR